MEDFEDIWEEFETFRNIDKVQETEIKVYLYSEYTCQCGGMKHPNRENMPVCSSCGRVDKMCLDDSPEWTSGVSEGGVSTDPSRCGTLATDTGLFSAAWGTGTIISAKYKASYAMRRMARINFHASMNHKDRSLFHAYKDIDEAAKDALKIPEHVVRDAKVMYRKFNDEKLTRGAIRFGIKANCVLYACKLSNLSRTTKEVADAFGIPTKDISRTSHLFRETILSETQKNTSTIIKPIDVFVRLFNSFDIVGDKHRVGIKCRSMCIRLEECIPLMGKTPTSVASVVILLVVGSQTSKQEVCEKCGISMPTLNKIESLVKIYLEENPV